jgi:deazaflavin-dependent oxidoreductase (nitroreductase family)
MLKTAAVIFFLLLIPPLLLRFRPRWVAAFNLKVTNRITAPFATGLPGFGVITHIGRKSARPFHTPVNVFPAPEGFLIALTYGPNSHWVQNVLAAGSAELETRRTKHHLSSPTVVHDPTRHRFPLVVRTVLRLVGATDFLQVSSSRIK